MRLYRKAWRYQRGAKYKNRQFNSQMKKIKKETKQKTSNH